MFRWNDRLDAYRTVYRTEKDLLLAAAALGCTSLVTQVILVREFLSIFSGNELVIGIILANWMALTGGGALLAKYAVRFGLSIRHIVVSLLLMALLPAVMVFMLRYLRNIVFDAGTMVGLLQILYTSFLLMLPYCLLTGYLFVIIASGISARRGVNLIPVIYATEALGSIAGGVLMNCIMVYFLKTFQSLFLLLVIDLFAAYILSKRYTLVTLRFVSIGLLIVSTLFFLLYNPDDRSKKFLFPGQDVLSYHDTPYGNLTVTRQAEQINFFENDVLLCSTTDVTQAEEAVHYAMVQSQQPRTVLLLSGGISGTTTEILKYHVDHIDYLELNPWIISLGKEYTTALTDGRIHSINEDARRFIKNTPTRYDVVLINLPDPITTQINRFYTEEFLRELKSKLTDSAVVSYAVLPAQEYISGAAGRINSIMYSTLQSEFRNVLIIPGMKNYFIASDKTLDPAITRLIDERGIQTSYVNKYYLDDQMIAERSRQIQASLLPAPPRNRDFEPAAYYRQLLYWLQYFRFDWWILIALSLTGLILVSLKFTPITFGVFTGGYAASSMEILLLLAFQIIYGYVYQAIGIIVTVFMAGLVFGSVFSNIVFPEDKKYNFAIVQCCIGGFSIVLPLFLIQLQKISVAGLPVILLFSILTFIAALLIGSEFAIAVKLKKGNERTIASDLYGIDLIGSAVGALLTVTYLLPKFGLLKVSIGVGILNCFSGSLFLWKISSRKGGLWKH